MFLGFGSFGDPRQCFVRKSAVYTNCEQTVKMLEDVNRKEMAGNKYLTRGGYKVQGLIHYYKRGYALFTNPPVEESHTRIFHQG